MNVVVYAENGAPVKMRQEPSSNCKFYEEIPVGTEAELLSTKGDWSRIRIGTKTGWMKSEFLSADDSALPPEDFDQGDLDEPDGQRYALYFTADELRAVLPVLENTVEQIVEKVGRG